MKLFAPLRFVFKNFLFVHLLKFSGEKCPAHNKVLPQVGGRAKVNICATIIFLFLSQVLCFVLPT